MTITISRNARDYTRISYYVDADGTIWHGPFCQHDNVHYKRIDEAGVGHSEIPPDAVQVTSRQAAGIIRSSQEPQ